MWASVFGGGSAGPPSAFASCAAGFNRVRDHNDVAAAEDLLARARGGQQLEELGKGLHILVRGGASEELRVSRACLEALSACVEWDKAEEAPYGVLLNREELAVRPELLQALVELLRGPDLWVRFWTLRTLLALCRGSQLPAVRGALLAAPEGPRLLADTVKDPREPVRMLGTEALRLAGRDCHAVAQLAVYGGAVEDLFAAVALCGGLEGAGAAAALAAVAALLEGSAANRAHFVLTGGLGRLAPLLRLESSDLLAEGLGAACELLRVAGEAREAREAAAAQGLLPAVAALALGRLPSVSVRLSALWALAALLPGAPGSGTALQLPAGAGSVLERAATVCLAPQASLPEAAAAAAVLEASLFHNVRAQVEWASLLDQPGSLAGRLVAACRGEGGAGPHQVWFACHVLAAALRDCPAAQQAAMTKAPELLPWLCGRDKEGEGASLPRVARLRLCAAWLGSREAAAALLGGGRLASLVECLLSASSDPHAAGGAAVVLRRLAAAGDAGTRDVLLKRVGADRFLAAFRGVLRSKEWEQGQDDGEDAAWRREAVLWYPAAWRTAFREEYAAARAQFEPPDTASGGSGSSGAALEAELVRARAAAAAAEREAAELRATVASLKAAAEADRLPEAAGGGLQLELLQSRDAQIAQLRREAQQLRDENERLLVLLADQEMALNAK